MTTPTIIVAHAPIIILVQSPPPAATGPLETLSKLASPQVVWSIWEWLSRLTDLVG